MEKYRNVFLKLSRSKQTYTQYISRKTFASGNYLRYLDNSSICHFRKFFISFSSKTFITLYSQQDVNFAEESLYSTGKVFSSISVYRRFDPGDIYLKCKKREVEHTEDSDESSRLPSFPLADREVGDHWAGWTIDSRRRCRRRPFFSSAEGGIERIKREVRTR